MAREITGRSDFGGVSLQFWCVGFLDLMGFRQVTDEFNYHPKRPGAPTLEQAQAAFVRAVHFKRRLVGQTREMFKSITRTRTELARVQLPEFFHTAGPDHVLIACPFRRELPGEPEGANFWDVFQVVLTASAAFVLQLAVSEGNPSDSLPLRGAIDVSFGGKHDGSLYAAALGTAYELESTYADYPRILVGPSFLDVLTSVAMPDAPPRARMIGAKVNELMTVGEDGRAMLDPFGPGMRQWFSASASRTFGGHSWTFVQRSLERFAEGPERVRRKYEKLAEYMRPRLPLWGVKP